MTTATVTTRIIPFADRVLVEPEEAASTTPGGIVIPDAHKEKSKRGRVEAVGERFQGTLGKGDTIMFDKFGGTELKIEGKNMLLLRDYEILCIVRESK